MSDFWEVQNAYYAGKMGDEELIESVTQPFYQSMKLTKRRMEKQNLKIQYKMKKNHIYGGWPDVVNDDGRNLIANHSESMNTVKEVYRGDKRIFKAKDEMFYKTTVLKAKVNGEEAACPKCGNIGKISTYIDGCDYCGAKFTVRDFEDKISAAFLEENLGKKLFSIFANIGKALLYIFLIVAFVTMFTGVIAIGGGSIGEASVFVTVCTMIFFVCWGLVPLFVRVFICSGVVFLIIAILIYRKNRKKIEGGELPKSRIPGFSEEEFAQNLEYKLRNIHYMEDSKAVNAFSSIDLTGVVEQYKDVIECNLTGLDFIDVKTVGDKYLLDMEARCNLTRVTGEGKVKEKTEKLHIQMSGRKDIQEKQVGAIRCYSCPNCGSTISLLDGGICEYCDTKLDYSEYGYLFEGYEILGKEPNKMRRIKAELIVIFAALFLVFGAAMYYSDEETYYQILHANECFAYAYATYDSLSTLDQVDAGATQRMFKRGLVDRSYGYHTAGEASVSVQNYKNYLEEKGYSVYEESEGVLTMEKRFNFTDKIAGFHRVEMTYSGNTIEIYHELIDE